MDKKTPYRIVASGKKAERRDYSKVSGNLELPNLVEIQTDSFEWFKNDGIAEVFNEIYPIQNYGGNIRLKFLGYEFEEPKYNAEDSMYRECNYAAPLKAKMELEITDTTTGEVIRKEEEVFMGTPYVWGGSTPETGFDCSGYVCWVYNQNGYDVGRTTANGLWNKSQHISEAEAKPGDLVFFEGTYDTPGKSHVGIYLGNGKMVSAGDPIKYADIHSSYWQKYLSGFGRLSK